jgi:hypothetical protein
MPNFKPHPYRTTKGGNKTVDYAKATPYIKITVKDQPELYIQKGKIMTADDQEIAFADLADWAVAEIKKCTPEALRAAGFNNKALLDELNAKLKETRKAKKNKAESLLKPGAKFKPKPAKTKEKALEDENPDDDLDPLEKEIESEGDLEEGAED